MTSAEPIPHASTPNFWKRLFGCLVTLALGAGALAFARYGLHADFVAGGGLSADTRSVSTDAFAAVFGGLMLVLFALATIPTEFFSVKDARPYRTVQGTVLYGGFMLFVIVPWVATFAAEHVLERHGYVECHIDNEVIGKFFKSHWAKTASLCEGHKQ